MGIFSSIFGGDPGKDLDRAEAFLADGHRVRALELAEKVHRKNDQAHAARAEELLQRCRRAVMEQALERSREAEEKGDFHDAADWARAALERAPDATDRAAVEGRLGALLERIEAEEEAAAARTDLFGGAGAGTTRRDENGDGDDDEETLQPEGHGWDYESYYYTLIDTLRPDVAERYEDRPEAFQRALVDLQEGQFDSALAALDEQASAAPDDPVLRFERGRARLATGDTAGARDDFAVAWEALGDESLDTAQVLSLPALWAEAALAEGDEQEVADRLEDLAFPGHPAVEPSRLEMRIQALGKLGRHDDARKLAAASATHYPKHGAFAYLLARSLLDLEEPQLAFHALERVVIPACAGGRCSGPALYAPSLRLLSKLYLERQGAKPPLDRVETLLTYAGQAQGGRWTIPDLELMEQLYRAKGEEATADRVSTQLETLRAHAGDGDAVLVQVSDAPQLGGGKSVL